MFTDDIKRAWILSLISGASSCDLAWRTHVISFLHQVHLVHLGISTSLTKTAEKTQHETERRLVRLCRTPREQEQRPAELLNERRRRSGLRGGKRNSNENNVDLKAAAAVIIKTCCNLLVLIP